MNDCGSIQGRVTTTIKSLINDNDVTIKLLYHLEHKGFKCCVVFITLPCHETTNDISVIAWASKKKIAGKLVDDTEQVSGKRNLLGVKCEQNPPELKFPKEQKVQILGYFYACDFVTSYTSDITNGTIQSPSLNGFIGTNFISIRKVQWKLCQVTSGAWLAWKMQLFNV